MILDPLVLIPVAVGHLSLFVYAMNVVHGLGYSEEAMSLAKKALLALFGVGALILLFVLTRGAVAAWSWPVIAYGMFCLVTALVLLPLTTAYIHLRPRPSVIDAWTDPVELAAGEDREALIGTGRYSWMLRIPRNESFLLNRRQWEVTVPNLPTSLDGLSVLHFSDLHFAPCFRKEYFDRVFDQIATLDADLALFTGDLIDHDDALEWVTPLLGRVKGRLGSYAILGNHDAKHDEKKLKAAVSDAGFVPLDGRWSTVHANGATIALAGTAHPWGPKPDLSMRPEADLQVLLSHAPDLFYWGLRSGFDLMLSGHNHGGQVRLPILGPVFMPSLYSRRFDRGFFRRGRMVLHVSQGVAGQHPVRYGCPPEVGRLVLRAPLARRPSRQAAAKDRDAISLKAELGV